MKSLSSRDPKGSRNTRCPNCGRRRLVPADDITSEIEGYTFVEQRLRCAACGKGFIREEQSQRMIRVARRLGIWGEPPKLRRKLSRSGRGTVLRIPTDIERSLHLHGDETVLVSKAGKKIIIELGRKSTPGPDHDPGRDPVAGAGSGTLVAGARRYHRTNKSAKAT